MSGVRHQRSGASRARLARLHRRDPHCAYCGIVTVRQLNTWGEPHPGNLATLDHLISRNERPGRPNGGIPTVLACELCNNKRGREELEAVVFGYSYGITEISRAWALLRTPAPVKGHDHEPAVAALAEL